MTDDAEFERVATENLTRLTDRDRRGLGDALAAVERAEGFATWDDNYPTYTPEVEHLLGLVRAAGFVIPFDWMGWDGVGRYEGGSGLDAASPLDAVRLITAILRSERFGDGNIESALKRGTLQAAVRRIVGSG